MKIVIFLLAALASAATVVWHGVTKDAEASTPAVPEAQIQLASTSDRTLSEEKTDG